MDRTCWLVAVICGLIGGLLMRYQEPEALPYHYEDSVKIVDGFYRGRAGTVESCYESITGRRSYTIHLETGGLVFRVAEEDLKLAEP